MYGLFSIGGIAMAALAAMNRTEMGCTVAALFFVFVISTSTSAIVMCGWSLIRTIDESLAKSRERVGNLKAKGEKLVGGVDYGSRNEQCSPLAMARKKARLMITTCSVLSSMAAVIIVFAVASSHGREAPIVSTIIPLNLLPTIWFEINLMLHSRRSQHVAILHLHVVGSWDKFVISSQGSLRSLSTRTRSSRATGMTASLRQAISSGSVYKAHTLVAPTEIEALTDARTLAFVD